MLLNIKQTLNEQEKKQQNYSCDAFFFHQFFLIQVSVS